VKILLEFFTEFNKFFSWLYIHRETCDVKIKKASQGNSFLKMPSVLEWNLIQDW
jgi:hypothetical protein